MGFRVEGVTEASLTSDVFVACLFRHSWRGLAGLSPSAFSEGVGGGRGEGADGEGGGKGVVRGGGGGRGEGDKRRY